MNFNLKDHTILLTIAGSRAYGTHTDESDIDVKGVAIPPPNYYLGFLNTFTEADTPTAMSVFKSCFNTEEQAIINRSKLEGSVYEIKKFLSLATDTNPNVLDVLFCRDDEIRHITYLGKILRDNRHLFISAKAKHTFSGYATSQLKRINTHRKWLLDPPEAAPKREDFELPPGKAIDKEQLGAAMAAIQKKLDSWEIDFLDMADSEKIYVKDQIVDYLAELQCSLHDKWLSAAKTIGFDDNLLILLEKEKRYAQAYRHWKQYENWKRNRNTKRAAMEAQYGYDLKHGMHLVRLFRMGKEIMKTGQVNVWRGNIDADELRDIRNGKWSYDKLVAWATEQDEDLKELYRSKKYDIPSDPPRVKIDKLCQELIYNTIKGYVP